MSVLELYSEKDCRYYATALLFLIFLAVAACSDVSGPPFIKAQVVDVYNNKTDIHNAHFCYWWQERGETAFLDTYSKMSRALMATIVAPLPPHDSESAVPVQIHLRDIQKIVWQITKSGKKMFVYQKHGPVVETQCLFPQNLRVDPQAGLADYTCFITGSLREQSRDFDFRLDLNFAKSITIIGVDEGK